MNKNNRTRRHSYVIPGAIGFGIGGAAGGWWFNLDNPVFPVVFGIMGAVGGAVLGLALKSWRRAGQLALAGLIGFGAGWLPLAIALMGVADQNSITIDPGFLVFGTLGLFINGAIEGLVGSVALWIVLRKRPRAMRLILAGPIGFAIGALASWGWGLGLNGSVTVAIWGIIGGAFLGYALGYQEKAEISLEENINGAKP